MHRAVITERHLPQHACSIQALGKMDEPAVGPEQQFISTAAVLRTGHSGRSVDLSLKGGKMRSARYDMSR